MCKYKTSIETKAYFMCWTEVETISLFIQNKFSVCLKMVGYETFSNYYSQGIFQTKRRDFLWPIRGFFDYQHRENQNIRVV